MNSERLENNHHARIISVINMKGGVGKTTLSINIADKLADKGNKVLVIDTDPQFNATQALLLYTVISQNQTELAAVENESDERQDAERKADLEEKSAKFYNDLSTDKKTIFQIFGDTPELVDSTKDNNLVYPIKANLDLIPGDLSLASTISGDTSGKVSTLEDHIEKYYLDETYDYIFIDCPPTWSILTHSSLYASDYYLIPSKLDFYSSLGIELLQDRVSTKILNDSMYRKTQKKLSNLGVIFTLYSGLVSEQRREQTVEKNFNNDMSFFSDKIPYFKSASTHFILYSQMEQNRKYDSLNNALDKIVTSIEHKIDQEEQEEQEEQEKKQKK